MLTETEQNRLGNGQFEGQESARNSFNYRGAPQNISFKGDFGYDGYVRHWEPQIVYVVLIATLWVRSGGAASAYAQFTRQSRRIARCDATAIKAGGVGHGVRASLFPIAPTHQIGRK